jgi:hypothetical protein
LPVRGCAIANSPCFGLYVSKFDCFIE